MTNYLAQRLVYYGRVTVQLRSREHTYQHQKSLNRQHKAQYLTFCSIRYVVYKNDESYRPLETPLGHFGGDRGQKDN